jgi:hypothetical protein
MSFARPAETQIAVSPFPGLPRTLMRLARGTTVNERTLLATDYLNHFNELIMLLEMVPDMPECLEDVKAWQPKTYEAHFAQSGFAYKALALLAYDNAPAEFRQPFDTIVLRMNTLIKGGIATVESAVKRGRLEEVRFAVDTLAKALHNLVGAAGNIINGHVALAQAKPAANAQADIDKLFD